MLELATDVCRDIQPGLPGNFQRCRKSYCRQPQIIIWKFAAVARTRFRNGSVRRYAITNAINERWKTLVISFNRATVFGQHVHVGCASGDDAIYLLHGLSRFVPHFIALSAASPYMQGTDTRFASSRPNIFSAFPDNGPMPWVSNWQQFEALFRCLSYTTMIDSIKDLHWDIRPSPHFWHGGGSGNGYPR